MLLFLDEKSKHASVHDTKHIRLPRDLQSLNVAPGDVVQHIGNVFTWTNDCVDEVFCKKWRTLGDPLCDAALDEILFSRQNHPAGLDLFDLLESYVLDSAKDTDSPATLFWREAHKLPPPSLCVSDRDVSISQELFLDHAIQMVQALMYYSLAGGFASPRIVRTLRAVSYLVPSSNGKTDKDRTFRRLLETFQFILEAMGCTGPTPTSVTSAYVSPAQHLLPGGEGWKAILRVRMLHGVVRRTIKSKGKLGEQAKDDVPISQEDMSATLASFSTVPLWALTRLHLHPTRTQSDAFISTWRHIGFYLGVHPEILERYFTCTEVSDHFLASLVIQLFDEEDMTHSPTLPILNAISNRRPLYNSFEHNCALATHLLDTSHSTQLGVPPSSWRRRNIYLPITLFIHRYPIRFSRTWGLLRPEFQKRRRSILKEGMARSVKFALGMRKTIYRPNKENGELAANTPESESVVPDPAGARALIRAWQAMLIEMTAVSLVAAAGLTYGIVFIGRSLLH